MIVSDSTTLIILWDLARMELLSNLFSKILIPKSVYQEISAKEKITLPGFMEVRTVRPSEKLETLSMLLDAGESEAIALALELNMPLIIDEKKGRTIAMREGIIIMGLLGVVYLNIKKGFIREEEARRFLDDAVVNGYHISKTLVAEMFASL